MEMGKQEAVEEEVAEGESNLHTLYTWIELSKSKNLT